MGRASGKRTIPNGLLGELCLLANAVRKIREFALVRANGGQVLGLTDQI